MRHNTVRILREAKFNRVLSRRFRRKLAGEMRRLPHRARRKQTHWTAWLTEK